MNTHQSDHPLDHAPKLWQWYRLCQVTRPKQTFEVFLWNLVLGLLTPGKESSRYWIQAIETLLRSSNQVREDFLLSESLGQELGKPVTEILGLLCDRSIRAGDGARAFRAIQSLTEKTNLSAIRFLSAWLALNLGDLEACIEECEKELEPHASINTLLGQALLEVGRTADALDALRVAIKLDPHDPLSLFQLVKALLVLERLTEAIEYIEICRNLTGDNIEVDCLCALVAISDKGANQAFAQKTGERLLAQFQSDPGNLDLLCLSFEVHEMTCDQSSVAILFKDADFSALKLRREFAHKMSGILRSLGARGWFGLSQLISEKLLDTKGQGTLTHQ